MAIEANELIVLIIASIGLLTIIFKLKKDSGSKWMKIAYSFLFLGLLATVLEGFFWGNILNLVEHFLGIFVAGILFLATAVISSKRMQEILSSTKKKTGKKK